jgi:hypothetical protein
VIKAKSLVRDKGAHPPGNKKVWKVVQVRYAIQTKSPLSGRGYEIRFRTNPWRLKSDAEAALKMYLSRYGTGASIVAVAWLDRADFDHDDGAKRGKNLGMKWTPLWELEEVPLDDPGRRAW